MSNSTLTTTELANTSGWLFKRGRINKAWRHRYFCLSNGWLEYYTSLGGSSAHRRGAMDVTGAQVLLQGPSFKYSIQSGMVEAIQKHTTPLEALLGMRKTKGHKGTKLGSEGSEGIEGRAREGDIWRTYGYLFVVVTTRRTLVLMATSEKEALRWKFAMEAAVPISQSVETGNTSTQNIPKASSPVFPGRSSGGLQAVEDYKPQANGHHHHHTAVKPEPLCSKSTSSSTRTLTTDTTTTALTSSSNITSNHPISTSQSNLDIGTFSWEFVYRLRESDIVMSKIHGVCQRFLQDYLGGPDFMQEKVEDGLERLRCGLRCLVQKNFQSLVSVTDRSEQREGSRLKMAAEALTSEAVYSQVFGCLVLLEAERDRRLGVTLYTLPQVDLSLLGITEEHKAVLPNKAVKLLKALPAFHTPLQKAVVLQRCIELISREVERRLTSLVLTADHLIPIVILLLIKAQVPHFLAESLFVDHFLCVDSPESPCRGEMAFHLVTFVAAAEYLLSAEVARIVIENTNYDFLKPVLCVHDDDENSSDAPSKQYVCDDDRPLIDI